MPLAIGTRLGPYEILGPLGAGGMGEVYQARDPRLGREVAIKVLPESLSTDRDHLRRFELEARAASALNHPNILTVHDTGSFERAPYVVSELLTGATLRVTLANGRMPLHQALDVATQVARGLAAAHDKGIVHRDLKPENLFVCADGRVKILDFGLAKLVVGPTEASHSESSTRALGTASGVLLGTPGYMSPEQVRGESVDARSDLFSFGAVLFEMVSGQRAFAGTSEAERLSAILRDDPPDLIGHGGPETPPALARIVRRCLEKSPAARFQSTHDLAFALESLVVTPDERMRPAPPVAQLTTRSVLPLPEGTHLSGGGSSVLAISRDGTRVAFVAAGADGDSALYVTHLERGETERIPGSESADGPFFSPDGDWVAFAADLSPSSPRPGELRKHSFSTGLTQAVCPLAEFDGGWWDEDGDIYFIGTSAEGLWRVRPAGGGSEPVFREFRVGGALGARCLGSPRVLVRGRSVLVKDWDASVLGEASALDLATGEVRPIGGGGSFAVFVPTGHVLFTRADGVLYAAPWDSPRGRMAAAPAAVVKDVSLDSAGGAFAVSDTGTLVHARGPLRGSHFEPRRIVRLDASGHEVWASPAIQAIAAPVSLSPDGAGLAVASRVHGIWVFDAERGTRTRLPIGSTRLHRSPVWTPDAARVVFRGASVGEMGLKVFQQAADASSEPEVLYGRDAAEKRPRGFTADGSSLLWEMPASGGGYELWELPISGAESPRRLLAGPLEASSLSPDGRWLAYQSGEIGSIEIHVRGFMGGSRPVQASMQGGRNPRWSRDGRELFYQSHDRLVAVSFEERDRHPHLGPPRVVLERPGIDGYEPLPGAVGFVIVERMPGSGIVRALQLATGWFEELQRVVPTVR